jgi:tRNA-modifying protein YgfZ
MMPVNPAQCHSYLPACWIRVAGPDAAAFLQGQFTNDVRLAGPDKAVYGLWLNQKGKVLADSFILGGAADEFWIGSYFSPSSSICRRLEDFIVADDVALEDVTPGWAGVSLIGEGSGAWLANAAPREGRVFPGRRASVENWEWVHPVSAGDSVRTQLAGSRALDAGGVERLRIEAGIPAVPADIGPGDLPHEGGLDDAAISSTKGCYLGQEIIARLKSKGTIRRRLFRVRGRGPVPPVPAALSREGHPAGELRSAVPDRSGMGFIGLALLKVDAVSRRVPPTTGPDFVGALLQCGDSAVEIV